MPRRKKKRGVKRARPTLVYPFKCKGKGCRKTLPGPYDVHQHYLEKPSHRPWRGPAAVKARKKLPEKVRTRGSHLGDDASGKPVEPLPGELCEDPLPGAIGSGRIPLQDRIPPPKEMSFWATSNPNQAVREPYKYCPYCSHDIQ